MLYFCALLAAVIPTIQDDAGSSWNRFRGPNGSGVAQGCSFAPDALGPEDHCVWRTELSTGYASPVLTAEHLFVTRRDEEQLLTVCLDRYTGELLWEVAAPKDLDKAKRYLNSPAPATAATDGSNVYVFFEFCGGLLSYDAEGELRWSLDPGPFKSPYGLGASPVLAGDTLVLQCDHDAGSFLLAVDKNTGKERWRTERPGTLHGFSSPTVYRPDDGPAQIITSSSYEVAGYALEDGAKLWWVGGMAWQAKSLPVLLGDRLFVHSWMASATEFGARNLTQTFAEALEELDLDGDGRISKQEALPLGVDSVWFLYDLDIDGGMDDTEWSYALRRTSAGNGLYAIELGGKGDLTDQAVLWRYRRSLPNIPSPLVVEDLIYLLKEGGILTSVNLADGTSVHSARIEGAPGDYYASPIAVGDRIITASHAGQVAVIEAGPEWKVLNVRDFGEEIWSTPAIDGDQIFLRTQAAVYGFERQS